MNTMWREEAEVQRKEAAVWKKIATLMEEALEYIGRAHHATVEPSKLHNPENVGFNRCQAKTCLLAHTALDEAVLQRGDTMTKMAQRVRLYRVEIEDDTGRGWYTRVEADSRADARIQTRRKVLMLGDTITDVSGPFYVTGRARFASGWIER